MPGLSYKTVSWSKYYFSHFYSRGNDSTNIRNVRVYDTGLSLLKKIIVVNNWVVEGCITWSAWPKVDFQLCHLLCDLRETTDVLGPHWENGNDNLFLIPEDYWQDQVNIYESAL